MTPHPEGEGSVSRRSVLAGPGLRIELDDNALADKIDHDWKNRELYDPDDGSVLDW